MLRRAVAAKRIPMTEICDLVRKSEENGHQHIFLFEPTTDRAAKRYLDGCAIAESLFEDNWGPDIFPNFDRPRESESWADFRTQLEGGRKGWLGKIYGHERISRLRGRERQEARDGYIETLRYQFEDYSTVSVIRFQNQMPLEIRIDQTGAIKVEVIPGRLARVWGMLSRVVDQNDFRPYNLGRALTRMMIERVENADRFRLGSVRVSDEHHGAVQFDPYEGIPAFGWTRPGGKLGLRPRPRDFLRMAGQMNGDKKKTVPAA